MIMIIVMIINVIFFLFSFIVILFVLFGGSAGAIIFLHTQFGWKVSHLQPLKNPLDHRFTMLQAVEAVLVQELHRNLPSYSADSLLTRWFWDWVQPTFECCGVEVGRMMIVMMIILMMMMSGLLRLEGGCRPHKRMECA